MTDDELNAAVATKVMGWRVHHRNTAHYVAAKDYNWLESKVEAWIDEWRPSTSIADAWRMEERILELKLWNKYVAALLLIKLGKETPAVTLVEMFNLIHATPRERTMAAVEAAKGAETK